MSVTDLDVGRDTVRSGLVCVRVHVNSVVRVHVRQLEQKKIQKEKRLRANLSCKIVRRLSRVGCSEGSARNVRWVRRGAGAILRRRSSIERFNRLIYRQLLLKTFRHSSDVKYGGPALATIW